MVYTYDIFFLYFFCFFFSRTKVMSKMKNGIRIRIFRGWVKIGKGGNKLIPYTFLYFKKQLLDVSTIHSPYPSIQTLRPIPSLFSAFLSSSTPSSPSYPFIFIFLIKNIKNKRSFSLTNSFNNMNHKGDGLLYCKVPRLK